MNHPKSPLSGNRMSNAYNPYAKPNVKINQPQFNPQPHLFWLCSCGYWSTHSYRFCCNEKCGFSREAIEKGHSRF